MYCTLVGSSLLECNQCTASCQPLTRGDRGVRRGPPGSRHIHEEEYKNMNRLLFSLGFLVSFTRSFRYNPSLHKFNSLACRFLSSQSSNIINEGNIVQQPQIQKQQNLLSDSDLNKMKGPNDSSLRLKVRQHVNPLSAKYQQPLKLENDWMENAFAQPNLPLVLDIGCSKGTYCLQYAEKNPNINVLGLEIRKPVVELALSRKIRWGLNNVHFLSSNANVDLQNILQFVKDSSIKINLVSIQFPDPYFKKKQQKRRVVNSDLVRTLAKYLDKDTQLYVQSDVEDVEVHMIQVIYESSYFNMFDGYDMKLLTENKSATGIETEREIATAAKGLPVYRMLFKRNQTPITKIK